MACHNLGGWGRILWRYVIILGPGDRITIVYCINGANI